MPPIESDPLQSFCATQYVLSIQGSEPFLFAALPALLEMPTMTHVETQTDEKSSPDLSFPITLTPPAWARVAKILANHPNKAFCISVSGGGCSGFQYAFDLMDIPRADTSADYAMLERDGLFVMVDRLALDYITGAKIDYVDELIGQSFKVENPQAKSSCGCGVSFSI